MSCDFASSSCTVTPKLEYGDWTASATFPFAVTFKLVALTAYTQGVYPESDELEFTVNFYCDESNELLWMN